MMRWCGLDTDHERPIHQYQLLRIVYSHGPQWVLSEIHLLMVSTSYDSYTNHGHLVQSDDFISGFYHRSHYLRFLCDILILTPGSRSNQTTIGHETSNLYKTQSMLKSVVPIPSFIPITLWLTLMLLIQH